MKKQPHVIMLLDVDGVLLKNDMYDSEWKRLAGGALTPLIGGDPNHWHLAQHEAWTRVCERGFSIPPSQRPVPSEWWDQMHAEWIVESCKLLGLQPPSTQKECVAIAKHALGFYLGNTQAIFPGTAEAIRTLSQLCEFHMASGNPAWIVEAVLRRIGVRDIIGFPFGSDLANAYKGQPEQFYGTILGKIGKPDTRLVVIDDDAQILRAVHNLYGAVTVKVGLPSDDVNHDLVVGSLAEVPQLIEPLLQS